MFAQVAGELSRRRPKIPLVVLGGAGSVPLPGGGNIRCVPHREVGQADQEMPDCHGRPPGAAVIHVQPRIDLNQFHARHFGHRPGTVRRETDLFAAEAGGVWGADARHVGGGKGVGVDGQEDAATLGR